MSAVPEPRRLAGADLAAALRDSRAVTLSRVADLDDAAWAMPLQRGVNPVAWELGHLAWFAEFWILRGPHRLGAGGFVEAAQPPRIAGSDALYDSARLGHAERWQQAWPDRGAVLARLEAQLGACIQAIPEVDDDALLYFHRLALFHEDMHAEAFAWLRAALGHPAPAGLALAPLEGTRHGLRIGAAEAAIGFAESDTGFAFDNEQRAHRLRLPAYEIDSAPVDNAAYLGFIEATGATPPTRWRHQEGEWQERWFDHWRALDPARPVVHVSAAEAEAFCAWAGRRLPSAAEWEHAAQSAAGFGWGRSVWEWTASAFEAYPGFEPGPYRDYSLPWFGSHRELRGGSFATHGRLHSPRYRNFFTPDRSDVFAGFRTARSLESTDR